MTIDDLTVNISHINQRKLLSDWCWLIDRNKSTVVRWFSKPSKLPILITASGDAFVEDRLNGAVHLLDVTQGKLTQVAGSVQEFKELLGDGQFVERHFSVEMIRALRLSGLLLKADQIYSFKVPPVLGGKFEVENIEATAIAVHFSVAGQIHKQVAHLPEGAPIKSIRLR